METVTALSPGQTDIDSFREEAGDAVGEMPREPVDNTPPPLDELRVGGTTQLGLFDAGGKKATSATVRLAGGKIGLTDGTAFRKGETVVLEVIAVITGVKLQDKRDGETGQVVSCEQQHTAHIRDVRIVGD